MWSTYTIYNKMFKRKSFAVHTQTIICRENFHRINNRIPNNALKIMCDTLIIVWIRITVVLAHYMQFYTSCIKRAGSLFLPVSMYIAPTHMGAWRVQYCQTRLIGFTHDVFNCNHHGNRFKDPRDLPSLKLLCTVSVTPCST